MADSLSELLADLDTSIAHVDPLRHVRAVRDITNLFVVSSERLSERHVGVYDLVLQRLLDVVGLETRVAVAHALAPLDNAPQDTMEQLARDQIEVAGPVLTHSPRLSSEDLVNIASTSGQRQLLAISARAKLSPEVTDVLIERGSRAVARSTAKNLGAAISDRGFDLLVVRSENDRLLQQLLSLRSDLPRRHIARLVEVAAAEVRNYLLARMDATEDSVGRQVSEAVSRLEREIGWARRDYSAAEVQIAAMADRGELNEDAVADFARTRQVDEVVCALSSLTRLPISAVETAMRAERVGGLMLTLRALNFTWPTVRLLLRLRPQGEPLRGDIDQLFREFQAVVPSTARRALGFMVTRTTTAPTQELAA